MSTIIHDPEADEARARLHVDMSAGVGAILFDRLREAVVGLIIDPDSAEARAVLKRLYADFRQLSIPSPPLADLPRPVVVSVSQAQDLQVGDLVLDGGQAVHVRYVRGDGSNFSSRQFCTVYGVVVRGRNQRRVPRTMQEVSGLNLEVEMPVAVVRGWSRLVIPRDGTDPYWAAPNTTP